MTLASKITLVRVLLIPAYLVTMYLSQGQAVAVKVKAGSIPASFDIGAKSITGSTAGLKVTIRNAAGTKSWTVTKSIESSTVQFIDLLAATGADASLLYQGAYVVITNTADGVLSSLI